MIALILPFMILAALGFLISAVVHLLALAGQAPLGSGAFAAMHGGIFVVWFPAVLVSIRLNHGQRTRGSWKAMLAGCPDWMRYAAYGLFAYAIVNFFLGMSGQQAEPTHSGGVTATDVRMFSGHWMLFYGMGFCIFFSAFRKPWLLTPAKCPAGHKVAHSDSFCPTCGKALLGKESSSR